MKSKQFLYTGKGFSEALCLLCVVYFKSLTSSSLRSLVAATKFEIPQTEQQYFWILFASWLFGKQNNLSTRKLSAILHELSSTFLPNQFSSTGQITTLLNSIFSMTQESPSLDLAPTHCVTHPFDALTHKLTQYDLPPHLLLELSKYSCSY